MAAITTNQKLIDWVNGWTAILQPAGIHWCDGSRDEYDQLCQLLVEGGTFQPLNPEKRPNSFLARSDPAGEELRGVRARPDTHRIARLRRAVRGGEAGTCLGVRICGG